VQEDCWADGLSDDEITLAGALKVAGYRTGMVGKWHLGDFSANLRFHPLRHGFDSFFGVPHSNDMWPCALYRDEKMLEPDIKLDQARLTGMYTKEAIDFIEKSKGGPFFLYLAHTFPHQPLYASERFKDKSKAGIFGDAVEGDRLERGRDHEVPEAERHRGQHHRHLHQRQRTLVQREPRLLPRKKGAEL
jgi:arylsulfatase A-like enzyme